MDWGQALSIAVGAAGGLFGLFFAMKWQNVINLLKELGEAITETGKALEDKKLTEEELRDLVREWKEAIEAAVKLRGK